MPTFETKIHGIPPNLPPGTHNVRKGDITVAEDGSVTVNLHYEPPEAPSEYLLVEVDSKWTKTIELEIEHTGGVRSVSVHGEGCCCKNCPWGGNHGDGR